MKTNVNKKSRNEAKQIPLGIKQKGIPFIQRFIYRMRKTSLLLDRFAYWRSPLLWLVIFINLVCGIALIVIMFQNWGLLPQQIPILYYHQTQELRFISPTLIVEIIFIQVFLQFVTLILGGRIVYKYKRISIYTLIISCISSVAFFASVYKAISMFLI